MRIWTYPLGLSPKYVSDWGFWEAIRELLQNAVDSQSDLEITLDQQPVFVGDEEQPTYELAICSRGVTLDPSCLLLGASTKANDKKTIGQFGEGFKLALLVLTRLGYPVVVQNGWKEWHPVFKEVEEMNFGAEQFCIDEHSELGGGDPLDCYATDSLTFRVFNLRAEEVHLLTEKVLWFEKELHDNCEFFGLEDYKEPEGRIQTHMGSILPDRKGEVFVSGLYVTSSDMKFGYDFDPEFLRLDRDRKTVNSWDLKSVTRDIWFASNHHARIAELMEENAPDVAYAEYSCPAVVKEACYQLFISKYPNGVPATSQEELKRLVKQGFTNVIVVPSAFSYGVSTSASAISRRGPVAPRISPQKRLEQFLDEEKYRMHHKTKKALERLIKEAEGWIER